MVCYVWWYKDTFYRNGQFILNRPPFVDTYVEHGPQWWYDIYMIFAQSLTTSLMLLWKEWSTNRKVGPGKRRRLSCNCLESQAGGQAMLQLCSEKNTKKERKEVRSHCIACNNYIWFCWKEVVAFHRKNAINIKFMFYVPVQVLLQNIKIKCELKLSVRVSSNIEKESVGQCLGYIFLFSFPITFSAHFLHLTLSRTLE